MKKLAELIADVRVCMMQTAYAAGSERHSEFPLHIRPMYTQKLNPESFDGTLYFFTDASSEKVQELKQNANCLLTYASPSSNRYVVILGSGSCERDPAKAAELWNVHAKGWWPEGPTSKELTVVRVEVDAAEYWDGPSSIAYAFNLLKAVVTKERIGTYGDHGEVRS